MSNGQQPRPRFGVMQPGRQSKCGVCQRQIGVEETRIWDNESDLRKPLCVGCAGGRGYVHQGGTTNPVSQNSGAGSSEVLGLLRSLAGKIDAIQAQLNQVLGVEESSGGDNLFG